MIKLDSKQIEQAKSMLYDLCILTDIVPNKRKSTYYENPFSIISTVSSPDSKAIKGAAHDIMEVLLDRSFDFSKLEQAVVVWCRKHASFGNTIKSDKLEWTSIDSATFYSYLAYICAQQKFTWNNAGYSEYEMADLLKSHAFAAALNAAGCFVSQVEPTEDISLDSLTTGSAPDIPAPISTPVKKSTTTSSSASSATSKTGVKYDYKSRGPMSKYVAGLISKPGEKETIGASYVYFIVADKKGKNTPNAFIHPVHNPPLGAIGIARVNSAGKPKVSFGTGTGYTDITIFSDNEETMKKILEELNKKDLFRGYSNPRVVKGRTKNPYYRIDSEFGEVLIRPNKLNESLLVEVFESMKAEESESLIENIEAEDNADKAINEGKEYEILDVHKFAADMRRYD